MNVGASDVQPSRKGANAVEQAAQALQGTGGAVFYPQQVGHCFAGVCLLGDDKVGEQGAADGAFHQNGRFPVIGYFERT